MERVALTLRQPVCKSDAPALQISFLTGKRYWYQTAFCAYSLARYADRNIHFHFYDDGTFDDGLMKQAVRQFPSSTVVTAESIQQRLADALPASRYPLLNHKRSTYPHIKKLTDVHAGNTHWQLVLDSDMLFFRRPDMMLDWLQKPARSFHMVDVEESYGYPPKLMEELAGAAMPDKLNVGMIGLKGSELDWDKIECWTRELEARQGSHYLQEQALTAMLIAGKTCDVAPKDDYVVSPDQREVNDVQGILHHYVAASKEWYFKKMWKKFLYGQQ